MSKRFQMPRLRNGTFILGGVFLILLFITGLRYLEFDLTMQGYTDISFAWLLWYGFAAFYAGYRMKIRK